jgi:hypothetical protein
MMDTICSFQGRQCDYMARGCAKTWSNVGLFIFAKGQKWTDFHLDRNRTFSASETESIFIQDILINLR